ncbi:hypothetical protein GCM10009117_06220 [Gangjinia marincola]|uniref:Gliding motility protein RemB n=1 Tax=Gangjinia marincola TaxID=578463 RepID=A0ABN1MEE3_9FLAO
MKLFLCLLLAVGHSIFAQTTTSSYESYPVFPQCGEVAYADQEICFNNTLKAYIKENFELPQVVKEKDYQGEATILFEVDKTGTFNILYIDAFHEDVKAELKRIFQELPQIQPATYNSNPTYAQYRMPIKIPLDFTFQKTTTANSSGSTATSATKEFEEVKNLPYKNQQATSSINIPLSHEVYSRFDDEMNAIGTNSHTASKPFIYQDVNRYYKFEEEQEKIALKIDSWLGRKVFNEHLIRVTGKDYWITGDIAADLQLGNDSESNDYTFNNTRAAIVQGGIGKKISFWTTVQESQGRFARYFNEIAESLRPDGGNPAIIPGRGIAKRFKEDAYDYPVAEGHISYSPSKFFNLQLGHGNNFIGDGYRSLLLSDVASPHPFLKLNTTFWKIKYTNTWMSLRDVRPEVTENGSFRTKFIANHYLSYNVSKRLNIGLFESVIWQDDNQRGFDFNYLNPVIFYRAIEFSTGSRGGNAIIGLSSKFKFTDQINAYGQFIIDEFSSDAVFSNDGAWQNKLGYQLGLKYFNAFKINNLHLQAEYNRVRPYTYSHNTIVLNYGHANQPMAHLWGANFSEFVGIARYRNKRWFGHAKAIIGKRGFDLSDEDDAVYFGGNIYRDEEFRPGDTSIEIGQGNTTDSFFGELEVGYLVNPATNLKLYGSVIYRDFNPEVNTALNQESSTTWINFGLRTDIFNWYYDY